MTIRQYLDLLTKYQINILHAPSEDQLKDVPVEEAEKMMKKISDLFNNRK